jgi:hypothetical protein
MSRMIRNAIAILGCSLLLLHGAVGHAHDHSADAPTAPLSDSSDTCPLHSGSAQTGDEPPTLATPVPVRASPVPTSVVRVAWPVTVTLANPRAPPRA